jgi:hypothetical protein
MIGRIAGILAAKHPPQVLVDVGGVGYEIDVPMSTFYNLPAIGEKVSLLTHLAIREDAHLLYGFGSETERTAFRELLKVSGIGAKTALSVLSGLSLNDLSDAIAAQEAGRFKDEIVPVVMPQKKGDPIVFAADEFINKKTSAEATIRMPKTGRHPMKVPSMPPITKAQTPAAARAEPSAPTAVACCVPL